jgi:hypothetical protein
MRLRAEMLPEAQRSKFVHDLTEMEELVGSSLDLFAELGRQSERQPVDVAALLESITNDWTDTGHLVTFSGTSRAVYPTEPSMLRRCINNLVSNAIRYGGRAHIDLTDSPALMLISVRDNGPGIDEGDLERVLEPFVRLEPSRNRSSGGTGIGLAISRNIARWHGGDLRLRNATGRTGLIAEISLPRERPASGARATGPVADLAPRGDAGSTDAASRPDGTAWPALAAMAESSHLAKDAMPADASTRQPDGAPVQASGPATPAQAPGSTAPVQASGSTAPASDPAAPLPHSAASAPEIIAPGDRR